MMCGKTQLRSNIGGWKWKIGNKAMEKNCKQRGDREQGQTSKPVVNPYNNDLDRIATTFYVSNFPDTMDSKYYGR